MLGGNTDVRDAFSSLHPVICFTWFAASICIPVVFMSPVIVGTSLAIAAAYALYLGKGGALRFMLVILLPTMLLCTLINPLFNHRGVTVLAHIGRHPVTAEAVYYGAVMACMIGAVALLFYCYNRVFASDKFLYIFGRPLPTLSLITSMTLRFIPRYRTQAARIAAAQRGIGRDPGQGNARQKVASGAAILSIMTTWALENSVETADSMKARGYGLAGRTAYAEYRFRSRDAAASLLLAACLAVFFGGVISGYFRTEFFPVVIVTGGRTGAGSYAYCISWALYCALPLLMDLGEEMRWRSFRSRI